MADSTPSLTVFDNISKWRCNKLLEIVTKKLTATITSHNTGTQTMAFGQESFTALDTKKDGVLDEEEISNYLQSCGVSAYSAEQKARSLIKSISDNDTTISKDNWVHSHISKILASDHVQKVQFDKIDTNQTGVITISDLLAAFEDVTHSELTNVIIEMDLDLDNGIKFEEFQRAIQFEPAITFNDEDYDNKPNTSIPVDMNESNTSNNAGMIEEIELVDKPDSDGITEAQNETDNEPVIEMAPAADDDDEDRFGCDGDRFGCDGEYTWNAAGVLFLVIRFIPPIVAIAVMNEIKSIWSPFDDEEIEAQCNGELNAFLYAMKKNNKQTKVTPDEYFPSWLYYCIMAMVFPFLIWGYYTYKYKGSDNMQTMKYVWQGLKIPVAFAAMMCIAWIVFWSLCLALHGNVLKYCDESSEIYQGMEAAFGWITPLAIIDICMIVIPCYAACCLYFIKE